MSKHSVGFQIKIGRPKFYAGEMITHIPWGQDCTSHHSKTASLPMNFTALVRLTADVTSGHAMFIVPFVQQTAAVKMFRVKISSFYLLYIHTAKNTFVARNLMS